MEKSSCEIMWEFLSPSPLFKSYWDSFRAYWDTLTIAKQRQIYYTLREQKNRGEPIKENPLFAIQDCKPKPTNWNGKSGIQDLIKSEKMVIGFYDGRYGTYTLYEAKLFEMKDVKPLNF